MKVMEKVVVRAPAYVKISGDHSVVYGGLSLSAAIERYATATVEEVGGEHLEIVLEDLGISSSFDAKKLSELYKEYLPRDTTNSNALSIYISSHKSIDREILPYATIAARLFEEHVFGTNSSGAGIFGKKITIHSDVPIQKGYASSAICSTAFTIALAKASGIRLEDQEAVDICRDGDRIIHGVETAGRMDVGPAYYGGYAMFSADQGVRKADISTKINIVIIDTGPKPPTSEMVRKVRDLYNSDTARTKKILAEIDDCVIKCIDSLRIGNIEELGRQMSRNHELLRKLGVSSESLDRAVSIAMTNGAYGAKLCGGGGGGMSMALVKDSSIANKVINALKEDGFGAFNVNVSFEGAKDAMN